MAHRVTRPAGYQGGASFNVFSAQGSNPMGDCKVCGKGVQKLYDKLVKTYVYSLCGGPTSKLQLPKDENKSGLQLLQSFVVFQIFVPTNQPFALELRVSDTTNRRRKMYFSTSFSDIKSTPLHCQIPLTIITRSIWLSLSIHIADLFAHCFKGASFKSVDTIVLGPVCKLRKIFTMRNRLSNIGNLCNVFDVNNEDYLPQEHIFALGVDNVVQILDMMALQMNITRLSHPSNGIEEDNLKLQKVKLNKLESHQVHVAFKSRMPLPLSTVQINTNLLSDNKSHSHKAFSKEHERIDCKNQNIRLQIEIPSSINEHNRVDNKIDNKSKTLQNLLKHANNFNKNHFMIKLKRDQILLDQGRLPIVNESFEKTHNVQFTAEELQLPLDLNTIDVFKQMQKSMKVGIEGIMAQTSLTKVDMTNMLSGEDSTITHLQWSNDEVHKQIVGSTSLKNEFASNDETLETISDKVVSKEPQIFVPKTIEKYKLPNPTIGLGKYVRRSSYVDNNQKKEYKQSIDIDSPSESALGGWISYIEDNSEEKPLEIPSSFTNLCDNIEDLERSKDGIDIGSTINNNLHLMDSSYFEDEGQHIEKNIQKLFDNKHAKYDNSSKIIHTKQSTDFMKRSTSKSIDNFMENRPRSVGIIHEKFDLGTNDNFVSHDCEFVEAILDEDYSFGRHSSSSNDYSQHKQDGEQFLVMDIRSSKNTNDLEEWKTFQSANRKNGNDSPNDLVIFLNDYINEHDSFGFDATIKDDYNNDLSSPLIKRQPHSKTSYKDTKISICHEDAQYRTLASSLDSIESISKSSISSFALNIEQEDIKEVEVSNYIIEHEDTNNTINNARLDEDLDLLYDPTLDCYYDPKTNRYYELK